MFTGFVAFALLTLLPGSLLTFGLPLPSIPNWVRLLIGVILAPIVVSVQFYLLRLAGVPFGTTTILLVALNLPVLYLIYNKRRKLAAPDRQTILLAMIILVVILSYAVPFLLFPQKRLYTWHTWTHADIVYALANGNLILEDAELAGVRLSYPWLGHVYQAVISYLANAPAATDYIWINLVWLLSIFGLAVGIVSQLGGRWLAQLAVPVWLSFGVNFMGAVIGPRIPQSLIATHPFLGSIWGDNRFTPWLDKVLFFGPMYFGMGFFIAILYLVIRPWPDGDKAYYCAFTALLLCGISLIYPILLPPACVLVGVRTFLIALERRRNLSPADYREIVGTGLVILVAAIVAYLNTAFLTAGRESTLLLHLNTFRFMRWRVAETAIVCGPLLIGLALVFRRLWNERRNALLILLSGALASFIPYIVFDIPWWRNEYKFIFTAAICLAPFSSLATEHFLNRLGHARAPGLVILTLVLAAPYAAEVLNGGGALAPQGPAVDLHSFDLQLVGQERHARLVAAIRNDTPIDSIIVLEYTTLHFPTLTQRSLYVAPDNSDPHPGVLVTSDEMLALIKGYPPQIVEERRVVVRNLFHSNNEEDIEQSLNQILELGRPVVLLLDGQTQSNLADWLATKAIGQPIYEGEGMILWLVEHKVST